MFLLYGAIAIFTFATQDYFFIVGWDHSLKKKALNMGNLFFSLLMDTGGYVFRFR